MGSHFDFKNISSNGQPPESSSGGGGGIGRLPGNFSLTRQPSVYSLTFEEFQNSMGGLGKDFGSMNMDEFLKNIWTAEETQAMTYAFGVGGAAEGGFPGGGNLQRQGSLTLPWTLSPKTVDEVWKDLYKDSNEDKVGNDTGGSNLPERQPTLREITLEEFFVRARVVREETQIAGRPNNTTGFAAELSRSNDNIGLDLGFSQLNRTGGAVANPLPNQSPNLAINSNGVRSSH